MNDKILELRWLMRHTVPVPGERAAAIESWLNALVDAGMVREDAAREVELARSIWRDHPWRNSDGNQVG